MKKLMIVPIFIVILLSSVVFAQNKCTMDIPFSCIDSKVTTEEISVMFQFSDEDEKIIDGVINVDGQPCEQTEYIDFTKSPVIMTCSKKSSSGQTVKGEIEILAINKDGIQKRYMGTFENKVEYSEPILIEPVLPGDTIGCTFTDKNFACIDFKIDSESVELIIQKAENVNNKLADLAIYVNGKNCQQIGLWDISSKSNPMRLKCKLMEIERKAEGKIAIMYYGENNNLKTVEGFFRGYVEIPTEEKEDSEDVLDDVPEDISIPEPVQKSFPEAVKDVETKIVVYENVCGGCLKDKKCFPFGIRLDNKYCDVSKQLLMQKENQASCNNDFECKSNNCKDGSCKASCEGCSDENNCIPYGTRMQSQYCSLEGSLLNQKGDDSSCNNNYECSSNICVNNKCISPSFIQKIIDWFSKLFGG